MANFKELLVWPKSVDFVTDIYKSTGSFPKDENEDNYQKLNNAIIEISKMLNGLINSLQSV
ncbi:hypothetical protein EG346_03550 [Chryseobacterium carnipullorum]|uniref:Four helix bundle protein n=2 Tax=Chryseobacterium carnipullorum TaxID=1124835 RepID=A0A3G6MB06_CHRCU|nr:hypothetical protein EG346_03550 [Chryseobacterium carnipullorum]AZA67848.1 hypothetical protein EG345_19660 [Chryseobacterium carnipullorum]